MKKGFTLLEVLITTLIASILSTSLLLTIAQVNRLQETVRTVTSIYGRVAILQNQMERDIMGAFIPTQVDLVPTTTEQKARKTKPVDKIFYGKNKGDVLEVLSFITTNPLQTYFGIKDSRLKPRVARVVYRLMPDQRIQKSFVLMRQEGRPLSLDSYTEDAAGDLRVYSMIDGIQSVSVQYVTVVEKKAEDGKVKRLYRKQNSWDSPKPQTDPKQRREPVRLPNFVELQLALWDSSYQSTRTFRLIIPIMAMSAVYQEAAQKKKTEKPLSTTKTKESLPNEKSSEKSGDLSTKAPVEVPAGVPA